jgi:hypothetical protein
MEELEQKKGVLKKKMNQTKYILFLTNLGDEIIFKGGRICKAQNWYKKKNNNKMNK